MFIHKGTFSVMPDVIRHPDVVPTKVGNHNKDRIPVFTGTLDSLTRLIDRRPGNDECFGNRSFMDRHKLNRLNVKGEFE
jgi:hypothetical protein